MQSRSASSVATHSRTESTRTNVMRGAEHASTDPFSLVGRFAVVTGGTKGLGEAIVEALCERGCRVFTCARTRSDVEERVRSWRTRGYDVDGCACDVSDAKARKTLVEAVRKWSNGTLHALVNNVGFNNRKPTLEYTSSEYAALMGTNLEASFEFCKEFHGMLRASGSGAIVFNSSVSGLTSTATGTTRRSKTCGLTRTRSRCRLLGTPRRTSSGAPPRSPRPMSSTTCRRSALLLSRLLPSHPPCPRRAYRQLVRCVPRD